MGDSHPQKGRPTGMRVEIRPSQKAEHKFDAVLTKSGRRKVISFGGKGYSDFTQHKDPDRKRAYLARHAPREDWNNVESAGFWARWLLWNKDTLRGSVADINRKFPSLRAELSAHQHV